MSTSSSSSSFSTESVNEEEKQWDTDEQVQLFQTEAKIKGIDPIFATDISQCRRFLRGRKGDVNQAIEMALHHQQWRKDTTPFWPKSCIPLERITDDILSGKAYCYGKDKNGRPVSWVRVKLHDANEDRQQIHDFVSFLIDESVTRCEYAGTEAKGQFTIVIDFQDFGYSNFDSETAIYILKMLSQNFPERMGRLYFVRESWLFWALWKIIETAGVIDARTARKIKFLGSSYLPELLNEIDSDMIPTWLNGTCSYLYDPQHVFNSVNKQEYNSSSSSSHPNIYRSVQPLGPRGHIPRVENSAFPQYEG